MPGAVEGCGPYAVGPAKHPERSRAAVCPAQSKDAAPRGARRRSHLDLQPPTSVYAARSGFSTTIPSGGRVMITEQGWLCQFTASACKAPAFPTLLPK